MANDYSQSLYNKRLLIPQNINDVFDKNFAFIQKAVKESDADKIVVVTHHLPTFSALEQRHIGDVFCGENTNFNDSALIEV